MSAEHAIPRCACVTCGSPRQAMLADLREQCQCDVDRICASCAAIGRLTDEARCGRCREWTPKTQLTPDRGVARVLCDGCWVQLYEVSDGDL